MNIIFLINVEVMTLSIPKIFLKKKKKKKKKIFILKILLPT